MDRRDSKYQQEKAKRTIQLPPKPRPPKANKDKKK